MSAVDFGAWVAPPLVLTLNGKTYTVQPPTVEGAKQLLAAAVRGEVNLGMVRGEIPAEVHAILDTITPGTHPALGDVWQQMVDDGQPELTINRMAYYATFYWARGEEYANSLAAGLWSVDAALAASAEGGEEPAPKGR